MPASAVPSAVVQSAEAAKAVLPVRVTVTMTLGCPSTVVAVADANWMVLSSSAMVTVVGLPALPPIAPERFTVKVRLPFTMASLVIGTTIWRVEPSASAQLNVPEVDV